MAFLRGQFSKEFPQWIRRIHFSMFLIVLPLLLAAACTVTGATLPQSPQIASQYEMSLLREQAGLLGQPQPTKIPTVTPTPVITLTPTVSAPDPMLIPPPAVGNEGPLQGNMPEVPNIYIVPSRQAKADLARFLLTTPEQLDWVNPRLPDPVSPGTVVVIPPIYRVGLGEALTDVVSKTTLTAEMLLSANPELTSQGVLTAGTVLMVPPLFIVPAETSLNGAAETLSISDETLLSANPELVEEETIQAGTVLIVPPEVKQPEESDSPDH